MVQSYIDQYNDDLSRCSNRWGITWLSVPSEVRKSILIEKIRKGLDKKPRKE
jgi:hypothetical protein